MSESAIDNAAHTETDAAATNIDEQEPSRWAKLFSFGKPKRIPLPRTDLDSDGVFGDADTHESPTVDEF